MTSADEQAITAKLTALFSGPEYDRRVAAWHAADRSPGQAPCRCPVCQEQSPTKPKRRPI